MDVIKDLEELAEIISIAIVREKASVDYYTAAYKKARSETARRVFSLLIEQEKGHEAKMRGQLHEINAEIEMERLKARKKKSARNSQE